MARLKVGDRVVIVKTNGHYLPRRVGMIGSISEDDKSNVPFKVTLDDGDYIWCPEDCVRLVNSSDTTEKPVTSFEVGKWYTYPGHYGYKPFQCDHIDNDMAYFGDAGRESKPPRNDKFREVPAPSQGHMHSIEELACTPRLFASSGSSDDIVCGTPLKLLQVSTPITYPYRIESSFGVSEDIIERMRSFCASGLGEPYSAKVTHISTRADIRRRLLGL